MDRKEQLLLAIGSYCRNYRMNELNLTLEDVANGDNVKTLSAFEHGRSSNMFHIMKYMYACPTNGHKLGFIQGLNDIMKEGDTIE